KAWGARCNADFISTQLDSVAAEITKIKAEDDQLAADIKELANAVDSHSNDSRAKRKALQERRNALSEPITMLMRNHQQGQHAMAELLASIESNMALAKHAEGWGWREVETVYAPPDIQQIDDL